MTERIYWLIERGLIWGVRLLVLPLWLLSKGTKAYRRWNGQYWARLWLLGVVRVSLANEKALRATLKAGMLPLGRVARQSGLEGNLLYYRAAHFSNKKHDRSVK